MLTFEPTVAMIATIALPCAAIILGAAVPITGVRHRHHRAASLALLSSACLLGTFFAATIVAHMEGFVPAA